MVAAHNSVSEFITPEMKNLLANLEFEVRGSQLDEISALTVMMVKVTT